MIYLDVTAACRVPLQTGIPRTTRALYRLLCDAALPLCSIAWQPFLFGYTALSSRARSLLEAPFSPGENSSRAPRDSTLPLLKASFADLFGSRRIPLRKAMRPEDILLVPSIFPDNRLGFLQGLRPGLGRKVAIFHDAIPLSDENVPSWEKRYHVAGLKTFASMDRVICISGAAEEDLHFWWRKFGIAGAPTTVLTWPVPFTGSRPPFTEPPLKDRVVLHVARLKQTKNHALLLDACERLWQEGLVFTLALIGCEDEARESRAILRQIQHLQAKGRSLHWHGHVSDSEIHVAYQRACFTVFPSRKEGFGLPILESFWHGRPVICSNIEPMAEVGRGPGCLLINPEQPDSLASAMRELLIDDAKNLRLARESHARPLRTWDDYRRELLPILGV